MPGGRKGPAFGLSQQAAEAGGSLNLETRGKVGAASTTTGRAGTARRPGPDQRDGEAQRGVNQRWNPRKRDAGSNLAGTGRTAAHTDPPKVGDSEAGSVYRWGGHVEGLRRRRGEAAGEKLGAHPVNREMVNMGTGPGSPSSLPCRGGSGQARRRLIPRDRGGAAVVVRGRESRPHGKGRQRTSSDGTGMPGGRR